MSAPTANQIARALAECAPNLPEKKAPQGVRPCGALLSKAGLWRQPRPTQATIFLHYSKYQRNAFDVSPTVGRSRTKSGKRPRRETPPRNNAHTLKLPCTVLKEGLIPGPQETG